MSAADNAAHTVQGQLRLSAAEVKTTAAQRFFQVLRNIEDFKTYISHYKAAQEETANFLSYYDTKVTFL